MENISDTDFIIENIKINAALQSTKHYLDISRIVNLNISIVFIFIGLIGNFLIQIVFFHKRFRSNPNHIYLLCSAINDNLFLMIHLFEDTVRTYKEVYSVDDDNLIVNYLTTLIKYDFTCRTVHFLRNILRFISSYIIVAFTIQRLYIVYKPLSIFFSSKSSAWKIVAKIILVSIIVNLWVPFVFQINIGDSNEQYCDIDKQLKKVYFILNIAYLTLVVCIPMFIIIICNLFIIVKTYKSRLLRKQLQVISRSSSIHSKSKRTMKRSMWSSFKSETEATTVRLKPYYWTLEQMIKKRDKNFEKSAAKLTVMLLAISFSFVVLNLLYLIGWSLVFYKVIYHHLHIMSGIYLFIALQVSETSYLLNYGLKFFIFCVTEPSFRNKLRNLSKLHIFNFYYFIF